MKQPNELTDAELSKELTDCRITLESVRPYKCRAISERQALLWKEQQKRIINQNYIELDYT